VSAENRLTAEQLGALSPGDAVTIESGAEFGRRRYTSGTVARLTARHVVVRCGSYVECYGLVEGRRDGGAGHAELVHGEAYHDNTEARQRTRHIDEAYREWARHRTDVERLHRLHEAIGQAVEGHSIPVH
jgi:hypothetical protein